MRVCNARLLIALTVLVLFTSFVDAKRYNRRHRSHKGGRRYWRKHRGTNALRRHEPIGFNSRQNQKPSTDLRLKDFTLATLHRQIASAGYLIASLTTATPTNQVNGVTTGPHSPRGHTTKHVARPRLLQASPSPSVEVGTDPQVGYHFTLKNFNLTGVMGPAFANISSPASQTIYAVHQAYDLRPSQTTDGSNMTASLSFKPTPGQLIPNQITLLLPISYNLVNLKFSKDCVFPVAASSPSLVGIDTLTGKVDELAAPNWLNIFANNAFEVFATQLGFGNLNSGLADSTTVSFPNGTKTIAEAQGVYSQSFLFADKLRPFRIIQIYCPVVDSADMSWSVNITGAAVTAPVIYPPTANTTNTTNTTNATNGVVDTSATNNTNNSNTSLPNNQSSDVNGVALAVGLVLGILLLIAIITIVVLCVKLSKKRREIITDEGYGPKAGFNRFDEERKVGAVYIPEQGIVTTDAPNSLSKDIEGSGWRPNETIVVGEDESHQGNNAFGQ